MGCRENAQDKFNKCRRKCARTREVPPPFDSYMTIEQWRAAICYPNCIVEYPPGIGACAAEEIAKAISEAFKWLGEALDPVLTWLAAHPEVIVAGVIVVGGTVMVITGGAAAPAIVAGIIFIVAGGAVGSTSIEGPF